MYSKKPLNRGGAGEASSTALFFDFHDQSDREHVSRLFEGDCKYAGPGCYPPAAEMAISVAEFKFFN
jgi:hypothetical protein